MGARKTETEDGLNEIWKEFTRHTDMVVVSQSAVCERGQNLLIQVFETGEHLPQQVILR